MKMRTMVVTVMYPEIVRKMNLNETVRVYWKGEDVSVMIRAE